MAHENPRKTLPFTVSHVEKNVNNGLPINNLCRRTVMNIHQDLTASTTRLRTVASAWVITPSSQRIGTSGQSRGSWLNLRTPALGIVFLAAIGIALGSASIHAVANSGIATAPVLGEGDGALEQPATGVVDIATHQAPSLTARRGEERRLEGFIDYYT